MIVFHFSVACGNQIQPNTQREDFFLTQTNKQTNTQHTPTRKTLFHMLQRRLVQSLAHLKSSKTNTAPLIQAVTNRKSSTESSTSEPRFLEQVGLYYDKAANCTPYDPGLLNYIKEVDCSYEFLIPHETISAVSGNTTPCVSTTTHTHKDGVPCVSTHEHHSNKQTNKQTNRMERKKYKLFVPIVLNTLTTDFQQREVFVTHQMSMPMR